MFKTFVIFEIDKKDTTIVIDALSKFTSDLHVADGNLADRSIYCVYFHCTRRNKNRVANKLIKLTQEGVEIKRLSL